MKKERVVSRLSIIRKLQNITQEDLAQAVGVTRQTIIAIEGGNYTPSVFLSLKIARFFKKKVEDIFQVI